MTFEEIVIEATRRVLYAADPLVNVGDEARVDDNDTYVGRLAALVDMVGWDGARLSPDVRAIMKRTYNALESLIPGYDEPRVICGSQWSGMICGLPPHSDNTHQDVNGYSWSDTE